MHSQLRRVVSWGSCTPLNSCALPPLTCSGRWPGGSGDRLKAPTGGPTHCTCRTFHRTLHWEEVEVLLSRPNGLAVRACVCVRAAAFTFSWIHDGVVKQRCHAPSRSCKKHTLKVTTHSQWSRRRRKRDRRRMRQLVLKPVCQFYMALE